ncbi:MarR family transcriptional regulator [Phenylobacterium sp. SCN 70-31]|uniref:MarR family winged helix-turn-helix transcriptional regulator n=1 Tax=Phenylobacterium sp. SCN 70-31 TaxID=1660129 RepID=UPI0025D81C0A|nr:MarR family transcriptional regulator [Phenylobacterium sp. SCN 70-31]
MNDSYPKRVPEALAMREADYSAIVTDDDRLLFLMDEISRAARRAFDERVQAIGLNRTQWHVLAELVRNPSLTQSEIAKRLEFEAATIGLAVSALERRGYVRRKRGTRDRRVWSLELTSAMEAILPDVRRAADLTHHSLWAGLTPAEKKVMKQLLERVSGNVRSPT